MDIFEEQRFDRMEDFLKAISYRGELYKLLEKGNHIYRGQASDKYELVPSALRHKSQELFDKVALQGSLNSEIEYNQILNEYLTIKEFYKICDKESLAIPNIDRIRTTINDTMDLDTMLSKEDWLPYDLWEIAALAQHYGLPTRLLDWSHDLYIALYFAIENYLDDRIVPDGTKYIVLWILNLPLLTPVHNSSFPLRIIQPTYHGNPNLAAQQGLFTMWQTKKEVNLHPNGGMYINVDKKIDRTPLDTLLREYTGNEIQTFGIEMKKILLPLEGINELYKFLSINGYTAARVYPGYYGAAKSIKHLQVIKER